MREIHFVELEAGGFEFLIVARHAISIEDGALRGLGWNDLPLSSPRKNEPKSGKNQNPGHYFQYYNPAEN